MERKEARKEINLQKLIRSDKAAEIQRSSEPTAQLRSEPGRLKMELPEEGRARSSTRLGRSYSDPPQLAAIEVDDMSSSSCSLPVPLNRQFSPSLQLYIRGSRHYSLKRDSEEDIGLEGARWIEDFVSEASKTVTEDDWEIEAVESGGAVMLPGVSTSLESGKKTMEAKLAEGEEEEKLRELLGSYECINDEGRNSIGGGSYRQSLTYSSDAEHLARSGTSDDAYEVLDTRFDMSEGGKLETREEGNDDKSELDEKTGSTSDHKRLLARSKTWDSKVKSIETKADLIGRRKLTEPEHRASQTINQPEGGRGGGSVGGNDLSERQLAKLKKILGDTFQGGRDESGTLPERSHIKLSRILGEGVPITGGGSQVLEPSALMRIQEAEDRYAQQLLRKRSRSISWRSYFVGAVSEEDEEGGDLVVRSDPHAAPEPHPSWFSALQKLLTRADPMVDTNNGPTSYRIRRKRTAIMVAEDHGHQHQSDSTSLVGLVMSPKTRSAESPRNHHGSDQGDHDGGGTIIISAPCNTRHKLHVDFEFNWTGDDPASQFELSAKLGQGYALLFSDGAFPDRSLVYSLPPLTHPRSRANPSSPFFTQCIW